MTDGCPRDAPQMILGRSADARRMLHRCGTDAAQMPKGAHGQRDPWGLMAVDAHGCWVAGIRQTGRVNTRWMRMTRAGWSFLSAIVEECIAYNCRAPRRIGGAFGLCTECMGCGSARLRSGQAAAAVRRKQVSKWASGGGSLGVST